MSLFPTKILVATDGPEQNELVVTTAAELAQNTGSELHVVHVLALSVGPLHDYPYSPDTELQEEIERKARTEFERLVERIRSSGLAVDAAHFRIGRPDTQIVEQAEKIGAGLIVVGSRGFGAIRRALIGDVSHSVVRHAHCPVVVVRRKPLVFPAKILLATDASEEAVLAASTAKDLARRTGSDLHVAHVEAELTHGSHSGVQVDPLPGVHQEELDRQAKGLLEDEVERTESSGTEVAGEHLRRGRADREIVLLAEEEGTDLIIMGSRGLGGIRRALIGSVSDSVVRHAHCPVMVVRPEKERTVEHEADSLT